jgi:hypothetical protein
MIRTRSICKEIMFDKIQACLTALAMPHAAIAAIPSEISTL